jgi:acyl carrier protein
VNSIDDLVALVRDELGLPVSTADAARSFDDLEGWDSVHLLWLLTIMERETGHRIAMPDVLTAGSLQDLYRVAVAS